MIIAGVSLALGPVAMATSADAAPTKTYKNCTQLNKVYPHGVGKPGAKDKTSGKPVTNFKRSAAIYKQNKKSDRDKDGIACEKR
ncbi:excalibur calcium-binding domain-containing protein [Aeromicrobium sp. UC242_57]